MAKPSKAEATRRATDLGIDVLDDWSLERILDAIRVVKAQQVGTSPGEEPPAAPAAPDGGETAQGPDEPAPAPPADDQQPIEPDTIRQVAVTPVPVFPARGVSRVPRVLRLPGRGHVTVR